MAARLAPLLALVLAAAPDLCPAPAAAQAGGPAGAASRMSVPIEYDTLPNGLRVVLSRDTTAPTAVVGVYYDIGFRIEPRGRTGFAHLFEHLMFQGSQNLGKMEFINLVQSNGGILNGSTRFDFTNYYEIVPSNTLEMMLWAEADRMRGLQISEESLTNQKEVVKNEVRVNVLNQPYGGFPWLDTPQAANSNWYNAHNFYGDLADIDAATLEDARSFFRTYYAPDNAVLVVRGDFDPARTMEWVRRYFGDIPSAPRPPRPDIGEPRQTSEKRITKPDPKATRPALAFAYHMPPRGTPQYYAMGLLNQILGQGRDSRLYQALVQERGLTGDVSAGVNLLGNMFDINGPVLWDVWLVHDPGVPADSILRVVDRTIEPLRSQPVDAETLERAITKMRSGLYGDMEDLFGFGTANLLAAFALFDGDPGRINHIEDEFRKVTPELLMQTAQEYLRPTNRTVVTVVPQAAAQGRE